jgi:hypothetical protein
MNMKKLLETINDLTECPPMDGAMSAPTNPGNPVTMSISLNASGKDHVADLINIMKNAGLEQAQPASAAIMPMRTDMERLRGIVDAPEMEADAAYGDAIEDDLDLEEYDNEPNPEYQDHKYMTKDLSGGLNREKGAYAAAQPGDNAMAVEDEDDTTYTIRGKSPQAQSELARRANSAGDEDMVEAIKKTLMAALSEKKAKPDFLDMDKDGDKKEPMKKAIADKKKKAPVKEVSDQERLSARKIQRDAQTARHGIERKPGESMAAYLARAD